jgi:hypothetical protein
MEVQTEPLRGSAAELLDVAEDIDDLLNAVAEHRLDLSPIGERWLVALLERIGDTLARERAAVEATLAPLALHGGAA